MSKAIAALATKMVTSVTANAERNDIKPMGLCVTEMVVVVACLFTAGATHLFFHRQKPAVTNCFLDRSDCQAGHSLGRRPVSHLFSHSDTTALDALCRKLVSPAHVYMEFRDRLPLFTFPAPLKAALLHLSIFGNCYSAAPRGNFFYSRSRTHGVTSLWSGDKYNHSKGETQ
jgi:hypothetical protein